MKALKTIFASLFAVSMIGCSAGPTMMGPNPYGPRPMMNSFGARGPIRAMAATTNLPFLAMFNNAYRGLLSENEPIGRNDPKNVDKFFISLIDSATKTLDGAFYDIDDPAVVNAFIRAK